ncbi:redox-sensitive transcriptional activator SoxR [Larsenimonas rhizosphaerae]|uniref:Redox-sensitive transcriptional activator SoxR n=1 Tax=Larsenimonas rhizosphaerae TaxID=2944682 RepID=A0AA41ZLQ2_9GAMM|nr:redox-sensitive transcriptional activator SoxR [Larsenimonas rhizosphaerae]MCX2524441.1 redox-sensitive transcriptional activator SoxR [Larsenimonas rhizosphaerae]
MSEKRINPDKRALSVGEVARRSGIRVSTVHYYDTQRLISSWRNQGNQRRFSRDVLRRIALIKIAQSAGIPLDDIRQALSVLPHHRAPDRQDWEALSRQWQSVLEEKIADLTLLKDQMNDCIGCGCLSLELCPLRNPGDIEAER